MAIATWYLSLYYSCFRWIIGFYLSEDIDNTYFWFFFFEYRSIFDSGVLKSPTIIVLLSISFLKYCKVFFIYLGNPMLGVYICIMLMSSWWILPLSIMKQHSGSHFKALFLKSILSVVSIATTTFLNKIYCYSITVVRLFSPSLHPTQAKPTSLRHIHPPPWFCPCVLYSSSFNPLFPLSPHPPWRLLDCS